MKNDRNIVLIGFMGCGKTTVGNLLAAQLKRVCFDTDALALARTNMNSINKIFEEFGEKYWRTLEIEVTNDISTMKNSVISTGGGIVLHEKNIHNLKKYGTLIYLDTSFTTIQNRLEQDTTRPLFRNMNTAQFLFASRQALYLHYADITLSTENKTPFEICLEIQSLVTPSITPFHHNSTTNSI
jgi:shikimate kinase